jgi:hypothetical protein
LPDREGPLLPSGAREFPELLEYLKWVYSYLGKYIGTKQRTILTTFSALSFSRVSKTNRTCPKTDPRFPQLVSRVTQNFDTFEDYGSNLDRQGRTRVVRNQLDQFYDYNYRRVRKPRVPLPALDDDNDEWLNIMTRLETKLNNRTHYITLNAPTNYARDLCWIGFLQKMSKTKYTKWWFILTKNTLPTNAPNILETCAWLDSCRKCQRLNMRDGCSF